MADGRPTPIPVGTKFVLHGTVRTVTRGEVLTEEEPDGKLTVMLTPGGMSRIPGFAARAFVDEYRRRLAVESELLSGDLAATLTKGPSVVGHDVADRLLDQGYNSAASAKILADAAVLAAGRSGGYDKTEFLKLCEARWDLAAEDARRR